MEIISSLRSIWKDWIFLYKRTPDVSPFLNPDSFRIAWRYSFPVYIKAKCRPKLCVFKRGKRTFGIVPIIQSLDGNSVSLFGNFNGFNECGLLYESEDDLEIIMSLMVKKFDSVNFGRISDRTMLAKFRGNNARVKKNVAIHLKPSFEEYFKSLSKSVRQNIRTAYNRLEKDSRHFRIECFTGDGLHNNKFREIIELYCLRHEKRYDVKTSPIKKTLLRHISFATRFYKYSPNALTFCLYIDNQLAGFMSGLTEGNRYIVPRLSISDEFSHYSPGSILICEGIKYLLKETDIRVLDLSQGEEEYKYKLGGQCHEAYHFELTLENIKYYETL